MVRNFEENLAKLKGNDLVEISCDNLLDESGSAGVEIFFSNGTKLLLYYWRLIKGKRHFLSCFDHQQKYGLPHQIDAKDDLKKELQNKKVISARFDQETGDFIFELTGDLKLQVFNFTSYEIWEISFPDGTGEYSNYAK